MADVDREITPCKSRAGFDEDMWLLSLSSHLSTIHYNPTCSSAIGVTHHIDRVKKIPIHQTAELFSLYLSN
jgi:hypothetical protein